MLRKIKAELKLSIGLRQLQKYCLQWRNNELKPAEIELRYEVNQGDEMQNDFGFDDIMFGGVKTRVSVFVAVLCYSRRIFAKIYTAENQVAWFDGIETV